MQVKALSKNLRRGLKVSQPNKSVKILKWPSNSTKINENGRAKQILLCFKKLEDQLDRTSAP